MLYLSLGENCVAQAIIDRHKLNTFYTVYSHVRSNIDYATYLESINYYKFLNKNNLILQKRYYNKAAYFSALPFKCEEIFAYKNGFEFTHHDILNNEDHYNSFMRKIFRMNRIRYNEDICFIYHYMIHNNMNIDKVVDKLSNFIKFYKRKNNVYVTLIYQKIVEHKEDRNVRIDFHDNIFKCCFSTIHRWEGADQKFHLAEIDDNLIKKAINYISQKIN